jgi:uncharacterized protein
MHPSKALIIFAKQPVAGRVKTRLCPPLTPARAADLYGCMLQDVLAKAARLPEVTSLLFYQDEPGAADWFAGQFAALARFPQQGADLGERMATAFGQAFARGFTTVAIVGSDSPDLPPERIDRAYRLLESGEADAVFGPSEDGGYYLLAMQRLYGELFQGIEWSTGTVLEKSLDRAAAAGIRTALLPTWHDVDTAADLERPELRDETNGAPATRNFLNRLQTGAGRKAQGKAL